MKLFLGKGQIVQKYYVFPPFPNRFSLASVEYRGARYSHKIISQYFTSICRSNVSDDIEKKILNNVLLTLAAWQEATVISVSK